jgi:hypothetical protein
MKAGLYLAALATAATAGCTERVSVSSASVPSLDTSPYHTFAMMSPTSADSTVRPDSTVAALSHTIRTDIEHSFSGRGYTESANPDFVVAYYGGTGDIIKVKAYPYGYSRISNVGKMNITDYPAGTLVVDVIDVKTNELVWRGQGVNRIPSNSDLYSRQIEAAVSDIVSQFPKAARSS